MKGRLALGATTAALTAGLTLAFAQTGGAPGAPATWSTRPEVPGAARVLVPFGIETTAQGNRAWALGRDDDDTVVLQRTPGDAGAWTAAPLPAAGRPVGGDAAPEHAAELTADGHGAILLADPAHPEQPATLLTRAPGSGFLRAPDPTAAVLPADEHLVGDATLAKARALLAAIGGEDAATFVAPTTDDGIARAVLRLDADGWHREDIDAPALTDPVHPVALAAAGPDRAWLLGTSGDRVVLLRRVPGDAGATPTPTAPRWVLVPLTDDALLRAGGPPTGIAKVEVSAPPADPLTVTADGLWIDLRVTPSGATAPVDLTEHLKVAAAPAGGSTTTPGSTSTPGSTTDPGSTTAPGSTTDPGSTTAPSGTDPGSTTTPGAVVLTVDGRWCDLPDDDDATTAPLCDHPLGFTFAHGDHGYRSVATPATADAKFGTRQISAPVDRGVAADARVRDAQRQGGYAALDGDAFVLRDGIGEDGSSTTQAIAFAADGTGFTGGTLAFGAIVRGAAAPPAPEQIPLQGDSIIAGATAPNGDGRVLALARGSGTMLYTPGSGWAYTNIPLYAIRAHDRSASPRVLIWPRPNLLIAGGAAGLLATLDADPVGVVNGFEGTSEPPQRGVNFDALPVQATVLAIACTPSDPLDCVAVGRDGLIVRGDGKSWTIQFLPQSAPDHTDITGVAFDGRTPLLATTDGLYRGQPSGEGDSYTRDDDLPTRMHAAGLPTAVSQVATVEGGGVIVDGRFARDRATSSWRATGAPLELFPFALAAYRDAGGAVRAIVSATPEATPLPEPLQPDEDDLHPSNDPKHRERHEPVPFAPSPVGAVTLRETADGWVDLDRTSFQQSGGRDLPGLTPNTRAILVDGDGNGLLLGGVSDPAPSPPYYTNPDEATNAPTLGADASVRRLERGTVVASPATAPPAEAAETPPPPGSVRLAIGGHPACLDRCGAAAGQGYSPDTHLRSAIARVRAMAAGGAGPAALLIGGGRASLGGDPLDVGGARRYRELTQGADVPTYVLPGPGDLPGGGAAAFGEGFRSAPAPQGSGDAPAGIDLSRAPQPEATAGGAGRSTFAFDVRAAAGTVRVIAIDNAAGRLAGGPDGEQARWIRDAMEQGRGIGVPSIVVGSVPLDDSQGMTPAADADTEIALLAGHASAYVATAGVDDPSDRHFGGVLSQSFAAAATGSAPLPLLQSSTLGYSPAQTFFSGRIDEDDATRQVTAALLMLDVVVDHFEATTGVAPVSTVGEPLLDGLSLGQSSRSVPLGWAQPLFVTGYDPSPNRFLLPPTDANAGGARRLASSGTTSSLIDSCRFFIATCTTVVPTDITFESSDPQVARFVAVGVAPPTKNGRRLQVLLDASGHVVDDPRGWFCPIGLGTTTVTATALGHRVAEPVRVFPAEDVDLGDNYEADPVPPGTCAFPTFTKVKEETKPAPVPDKPAPTPRPTPVHHPAPQHHHHQVHHHTPAAAPAPQPPATYIPAPPPTVQAPVADHAQPPVAPAPKPPAPMTPPAPPQGLQVQQVQAPQASPFQAMQHQEQRREEYAYENDSAAVAYAHPRSPMAWEVGGGAAVLLLVMGGGVAAGRARRAGAAVAARATVGRDR
ncbi:hypothetical protein [Baekduia sp. Peel2402]|uniref:hypothetical protein n=1 Tax=Baekduia sp. Peel2402 TaxID=3458296 RepID=UPI00403EF5C5